MMHANTTNIISYLYDRGLIAQITNEKELNALLQRKSITLYCGFDPTADSLHIGHLAPLLCLKRFQMFGHRPLILLGGATGLIGDPSFKDSERQLNSFDIVQEWIKKIKFQISLFVDCDDYKNNFSNALILNNYNWFSSMKILTFLRDIGKFFSINKMIRKDIIQKRLKKNNCGISYTEFSYNLMQSYDFAYLYKNYETTLQIGGSDQWGNIISGVDLIRRMYKKTVYGLTVPLITNINNIKFGKTENNTIWLDAKKTSPYKFYQYWINSDDEKAYHFLKFFTDINIGVIDSFKKKDTIDNPHVSIAQITLAEIMTRLIHGQTGLETAQRITRNLFSGEVFNLTLNDFNQLAKDGMPIVIFKSNVTLQQALVESKLATSRAQARQLIISNAITINSNKQLKTEYIFSNKDRLYNSYTLLKRGKKHYCLIKWESNLNSI